LKDIRIIQYEKVRELYQEMARHRNEVPDINKIRHLVNEVLYSTEQVPMCGNYRLIPYENVDINSLNAELGLAKADVETVTSFFSTLDTRLRGLEFVNEVWRSFAKHRINAVLLEVIKLTAPVFIKGFTEELDTAALTDRENTGLTVLDDGAITTAPITSTPRYVRHFEKDVSIKRVGDESMVPEIAGRVTSVVNQGEHGGVVMTLTGQLVKEAGFRFETKTSTTGVNHIVILLGEESTGINVKVELSPDGTKYETVFEDVIRRNSIDIPVVTQSISVISVELTMDKPNVVLLDEVRYEFRLYKVLMLNATQKSGGIYQTTKIPVESKVAHLSLVAEEEKIGTVGIKYAVSINEDASGNPVGFVTTDPSDSAAIINMSNTVVNLSVSPSSGVRIWRVHPLKKFGSALYNIFDCGFTESTDDFTIENGELTFSTNIEIVNDTVKLYRGSRDFIKKSRAIILDKHSDVVAHTVEPVEATGWIEPVELMTKVKELIEEYNISDDGSNFRNKVRVPWHVRNFEEIHIERDDGQEVHAFISEIKYTLDNAEVVTPIEYEDGYTHRRVDSTCFTFTGIAGEIILNEEYHHYATFVASLKDYIAERQVYVELDLGSFSVAVAGGELEQGEDYRVQPNEYRIELLKTGGYARHFTVSKDNEGNITTSADDVNISYDFVEQGSTSTEYYETNVFVTVPTEVVILPFTASEIASGNFHIVNDENVSIFTSHTLQQGWNSIRTTHPYPSVSEFDANRLTGETSTAGVVIPDDVDIMRPYLDSMRHISPFLLATLEPEEGVSCFSYTDGKVLVNFLPDYVEPDFLSDPLTVGTKGSDLLCKKPILDADYSNTGYTAQPEIFELEFTYYNKTREKFIFIRIEMDVRGTGAIARVNKLGLNKYLEVT
jgi:hypothetical protein